jgi:hypothetical protein
VVTIGGTRGPEEQCLSTSDSPQGGRAGGKKLKKQNPVTLYDCASLVTQAKKNFTETDSSCYSRGD